MQTRSYLTMLVSADYRRRGRGVASTDYPCRGRDVAATRLHGLSTSRPRRRLHGLSTSRPRRRRDSSPQNIHVAAAASPRLASTDYPRRGRGVAATRLYGLSTSRLRRRRDSSEEDPRCEKYVWPSAATTGSFIISHLNNRAVPRRNMYVGAAAPPRPVSTKYPRCRGRRDAAPRNIHVGAAAWPRRGSAEYPRRSRGATTTLRGIPTSEPRRRRGCPTS